MTETNGTTEWVHTNVFANGSLIATYLGTNLYFSYEDWLGTKRGEGEAMSGGATCLNNYYSLPFGNDLTTTGACADATELHFTQKERDPETGEANGNDYFGKRYYASSMGRWMSPDLINVTEERLLNPANTLNKYAYAANNPLGAVDPDGRDVTFLRESGSFARGNPFGHAIVAAYNEKNGQSAVESFGPANAGSGKTDSMQFSIIGTPGQEGFGLQSIQSADQLRQNFSSLTIQTTPEVTQEIINAINSAKDGNYQTIFNNCSDAAKRVLAAGGIGVFSDSGTPGELWNGLYADYSSASWFSRASAAFFGTAPHKNGRDYGRPRWGMDTFDMMFLLMKPDNSSVTATQGPVTPCGGDTGHPCTQ
jgi:RHS repeat-associated protein